MEAKQSSPALARSPPHEVTFVRSEDAAPSTSGSTELKTVRDETEPPRSQPPSAGMRGAGPQPHNKAFYQLKLNIATASAQCRLRGYALSDLRLDVHLTDPHSSNAQVGVDGPRCHLALRRHCGARPL
jgi:hypothetical protein